MTIEQRISNIESRLDSLQESFIQSQKNGVAVTANADNAISGIERLTPYTATQTAYYGESEKVFYNVPQGNITVFFDNDYSVSRLDGTVTIRFEAVTENTDITIMIQ